MRAALIFPRKGTYRKIKKSPQPSGKRLMASIAQNQKITLEPHAVCRQTNSGLTMLFDRAKGVMYELNESASAVVTVINTGPRTWDEIITALAEEFDAPRQEIEADVSVFIEEFTEAGLLRADG